MNLNMVRSKAESLARQQGQNRGPVNVDAIARALGLKVIYEQLPDEVSGLLISGPTGSFIVVQKSDAPNRQRFTVGHEIGHHVLGHQFAPGEHVHVDRGHYVSQRGPRSSTGVDLKEIEANQFAAALLMPAQLIQNQIAKFGVAHLLDHHVSSLADTFSVSEQAMTIRLGSLGIL